MPRIYFIYNTFTPNIASNNRALAYLKSLSLLHYEITVIFIMPDKEFSRLSEHLPGITVEYCWDRYYINIRYLNTLSYCIYLNLIRKRVKSGDVVYLYGGVDLLRVLTSKPGVRVFYERTEHPLVYGPKDRLSRLSLNRYFKYCRRVEGMFVISTCLRDYFVDHGVNPRKITIINSIVDTSRFDGIKKQITMTPYFAYCGDGNNRKDRVDELIRAFARVAARHQTIQFYIIGPVKQVYKEEQDNVQLVHELGLKDRVIFTGTKPAEEIPQLLVNAVALFLTRPDTLQNRAGFSTKLCEYLVSGNPVVTSGVGDVPLFLKDKVNAFVFSPGDYSAVETIMEYILDHPEDAARIGDAGKDTAFCCFNAVTETKKIIKAFENNN